MASKDIKKDLEASKNTDYSKGEANPGKLIVVEEQDKRVSSMPAVPEGHSLSLVEMAVRRGDSLEMVSKLMDLQDRHDKKEAQKAFITAMSLFKSEHLTILKKKSANFGTGGTQYKYASLDDIYEVVVPVLGKYGLSHNFEIEQEGDDIKVTCVLTHSQGHSEKVSLKGAPDKTGSKNAIQAVGSTTKYLSRYTFEAVTGISTADDDDDGHVTKGEILPEDKKAEYIARLGKCTTVKQAEKIAAEASKECDSYNDLKSYKGIKEKYTEVKNLIENPPE